MERLTWDDWLCGSYVGESAVSQTDFDGHKAYYGDAITLLAEYERTGLTPAEIVTMQANYDRAIKGGTAAMARASAMFIQMQRAADELRMLLERINSITDENEKEINE